MEIWKDIPGYEGEYQVSNLGRVKSLARTCRNNKGTRPIRERILKPCLTKNGYSIVHLGHRGRSTRIHRLVAEVFIPNPDNLPVVDHINGKRDDNRVENLRWVDYKENNDNIPIVRQLKSRNTELEAEVAELKQYIAYLEAH